jgi:hypothetical protein
VKECVAHHHACDCREERFAKIQAALRECLRYVESEDRTRGDLMGCAVTAHDYHEWVRISNEQVRRESPAKP